MILEGIMEKSLISLSLKGVILVFAFVGFLMCALWYPFWISLTTRGLMDVEPMTAEQAVRFWSQLIFYWVTSLPCFALLALGWIISNKIKSDNLFSYSTARLIKICAIILFVDLAVFLIGNCVFAFMGWNELMLFYLLVFAVGLSVACLCAVLSHYVFKAAVLQEEADGTI